MLDESGSKMNLTIQLVDQKQLIKISRSGTTKQQASAEEDFEKAAYYRDQINKLQAMKEKQISDEETPVITEKILKPLWNKNWHSCR